MKKSHKRKFVFLLEQRFDILGLHQLMGVNENFDEMLDTIDIQYDYLEDYAEKVYINSDEKPAKGKAD